MSAFFLAPLFLGGVALIAIPYWVHKIRRPQRDLVPFSSLMFVPRVRKEVIERQRIQHLLLMLLRMLLLILLALAFARPHILIAIAPETSDEAAWRLILLDTSASMGALGVFEEAKEKAMEMLASLGSDERVGVMAFSDSPSLLAPLRDESDPEVGSVEFAKKALSRAALTSQTTAYMPALKQAESLLLDIPTGRQEGELRRVIHLVSDFQKNGMPDSGALGKISPQIQLGVIEVGKVEAENFSIQDLSIREIKQGELLVRARIKNWNSNANETVQAKMILNGEAKGTNELRISAGAASQTQFVFPWPREKSLEGTLEIVPDAFLPDNTRYFTWNPASKQRILLIGDSKEDPPAIADRLVRLAFSEEWDLDWRLETLPEEAAREAFGDDRNPVQMAILAGLDETQPSTLESLLEFVESGGRALVALDRGMPIERVNETFLAPLGFVCEGPRHSETRDYRFATLSWIDLRHPIFVPFRGAQYNDFSSLRFFNYHRAKPLEETEDPGYRVLARFDSETSGPEDPAIIEVPHGKGRIILWTFGIDTEWSNLPKNVRFLPMMHETVSYLSRSRQRVREYLVGQIPVPPFEQWDLPLEIRARGPGKEETTRFSVLNREEKKKLLDRPGFLRWIIGSGEERFRSDPVNLDPSEGNLERIPPTELEIKLFAAPTLRSEPAGDPSEGRTIVVAEMMSNEYGIFILLALLAFLIAEHWYARRLA